MPEASHKVPVASRPKGSSLPAFCNVLGILLIVMVFVLCLPIIGPDLLGYEVFDMANGSMEPEIPVGSVVYVRSADPVDVQVDEVVAYRTAGNVVIHRVVANDDVTAQLTTKGDAGNEVDPDPVPYDNLIGTVAMHLPFWGNVMAIYESNVGRIYLVLTVACGIMLNIVAERLRERERARTVAWIAAERAARASGEPFDASAMAAQLGYSRYGWIRTTAMIVLALIFLGSGGVVLFVRHNYRVSGEKYEQASQQFVRREEGTIAPIVIDFNALRAVNEDVVGWIYCEGTEINYPVLHGESNDQYLRHDYTREYNINGSIFVDAANRDGFVDANTIIYGHHMNYGAMFANLDFWADQAYYDEHPVMWLLTPEQDYQVVLVSGHHTSAYSDMYEIYAEHDADFQRYLAEAVEQSDFVPQEGATVNEGRNYVMLTTCAYIFDNARYVLHGKLVPVESAGGVPLG